MFKNLTPHDIHILNPKVGINQDAKTKVFTSVSGEFEVTLMIPSLCKKNDPAALALPRAGFGDEVTHLIEGVPIDSYESENGILEDMPDPEQGVIYIVSGITAAVAKMHGRDDVVSPNKIVRDKDSGSVVLGCQSLRRP